jgi:hypothetical protein
MIEQDVKTKIANILLSSGLSSDEAILYQNLGITGMPQDDFVTSAYARKAKIDAEDSPYKYRCVACGEYYQSRTEFVECMESHAKDFMIGQPVERTKEYEEELISSFPPLMQAAIREQREREKKE